MTRQETHDLICNSSGGLNSTQAWDLVRIFGALGIVTYDPTEDEAVALVLEKPFIWIDGGVEADRGKQFGGTLTRASAMQLVQKIREHYSVVKKSHGM